MCSVQRIQYLNKIDKILALIVFISLIGRNTLLNDKLWWVRWGKSIKSAVKMSNIGTKPSGELVMNEGCEAFTWNMKSS